MSQNIVWQINHILLSPFPFPIQRSKSLEQNKQIPRQNRVEAKPLEYLIPKGCPKNHI